MDEKMQQKIGDLIYDLSIYSSKLEYQDIQKDIYTTLELLNKISNFKQEKESAIEIDVMDFKYNITPEKTVEIEKYLGFDTERIVIPDTIDGYNVTRIKAKAFKGYTFIKELCLNDNVTIIESSAFEDCCNLAKVYKAEHVRYIGESAFLNCERLEDISVSNNLGYLGSRAFENTGLSKFIMPKKIKFLTENLFKDCKNLKTVIMHDEIRTIGYNCFDGCISLESIEIPDSVKYIDLCAFSDCKSLRSLKFFATDTIIEKGNFKETYIWRPDLRYNPRKMSRNTEVNIECYPGSTIQEFCRENQLKCSRLKETNLANKKYKSFTNDIIGFNIHEFKLRGKNEQKDKLFSLIKTKKYVLEVSLKKLVKEEPYYKFRLLDGDVITRDELSKAMHGNAKFLKKETVDFYNDILKDTVRLKRFDHL